MKRLFLITILFFFSASFAASISVEKKIDGEEVRTGGEVKIYLEFTNPFSEDIPLRIVDRSVFAGNGIDIQCLERTMPANTKARLDYDPIMAFQEGEYEMGSASVTYRNPESGTEETVTTNTLNITVTGAGQGITQQGITTIYECGGMSMKSTSTSTSSSSSSSQQQQQQSQSQQTENKLDQMRQGNNQNLDDLKKQIQEQKRTDEEAARNIESDSNFQQMEQELMNEGYQRENKNIDSNNFEYNYKKNSGEQAKISGDLNNDSIENLQKWSSEDERELLEKIENDEKFRDMDGGLKNDNFTVSSKSANPSSNMTSFEYSYQNEDNETAKITGMATREGKVTEIRKEGGEKRSILPWLFVMLSLSVAMYFLRKKLFSKKGIIVEKVKEKKEKRFSHRKEALRIIEEAVEKFEKGERKEAYQLASRAIKLFIRYELLPNREEITTTEVLREIKSSKRRWNYSRTKELLELCDLVKFAKFSADEKSFKRLISLGRNLIV